MYEEGVRKDPQSTSLANASGSHDYPWSTGAEEADLHLSLN